MKLLKLMFLGPHFIVYIKHQQFSYFYESFNFVNLFMFKKIYIFANLFIFVYNYNDWILFPYIILLLLLFK